MEYTIEELQNIVRHYIVNDSFADIDVCIGCKRIIVADGSRLMWYCEECHEGYCYDCYAQYFKQMVAADGSYRW